MPNLASKIDRNGLFAYRATAVLESQNNYNLFKKKKYILSRLSSNNGNKAVNYLSANPRLTKQLSKYF